MKRPKLSGLRHAADNLGQAGRLGLVLIAAALVADPLILEPLEQERDALVEQNARMALLRPKAQAAAEAARRAARPVYPDSAEATLRHLFASAKKAGLSLDQGDYQLGRSQVAGQARYQVSLPVMGTYPEIRAFIRQALNQDPALALASVAITREDIEDSEIDATLQFILYMKAAK